MAFTKYVDQDKFFSDEKESLRDGFGRGLVSAGQKNENIVAVVADLAESTRMHWFKEKFPDRFIEVGITEQHMAAFGSGLATMGKIPFISSYAMFSPGRNWEQIRTTICYNDQNVKIVGSHAGVSVGPDGGTHQALEDIAILRPIPNIEIFVPADSLEAELYTIHMSETEKPAYIRLARAETKVFLSDKIKDTIHKPYKLWESKNPKLTIIASGPIVYEALLSAISLDEKNIEVDVINLPVIKYFDENILIDLIRTNKIIVAEEHQKNGGVFGLVSEILSQNRPSLIWSVSVNDSFGESGNPDELLEKFNLTAKNISDLAREMIK